MTKQESTQKQTKEQAKTAKTAKTAKATQKQPQATITSLEKANIDFLAKAYAVVSATLLKGVRLANTRFVISDKPLKDGSSLSFKGGYSKNEKYGESTHTIVTLDAEWIKGKQGLMKALSHAVKSHAKKAGYTVYLSELPENFESRFDWSKFSLIGKIKKTREKKKENKQKEQEKEFKKSCTDLAIPASKLDKTSLEQRIILLTKLLAEANEALAVFNTFNIGDGTNTRTNIAEFKKVS